MHLHGRFTGTDTGTGGVSKVRLSADVAGSRATSGKSDPLGGGCSLYTRGRGRTNKPQGSRSDTRVGPSQEGVHSRSETPEADREEGSKS